MTCHVLQTGYQSLTANSHRSGNHTDYYVVMSPGSTGRAISQEDMSDLSGESAISYREQLALLESHNKHLETTVQKTSEEVKKLTSQVEHLNRRVESLANQLRMVSYNSYAASQCASQSSEVSSAAGSPFEHRSSPICVDNRPPAPLPGREGERLLRDVAKDELCCSWSGQFPSQGSSGDL